MPGGLAEHAAGHAADPEMVAFKLTHAGCLANMLKHKVEYHTASVAEYEQCFREREIKYLERKAARFGFSLSPSTAPALAVS